MGFPQPAMDRVYSQMDDLLTGQIRRALFMGGPQAYREMTPNEIRADELRRFRDTVSRRDLGPRAIFNEIDIRLDELDPPQVAMAPDPTPEMPEMQFATLEQLAEPIRLPSDLILAIEAGLDLLRLSSEYSGGILLSPDAASALSQGTAKAIMSQFQRERDGEVRSIE